MERTNAKSMMIAKLMTAIARHLPMVAAKEVLPKAKVAKRSQSVRFQCMGPEGSAVFSLQCSGVCGCRVVVCLMFMEAGAVECCEL
mmetsp:Transcript_47437/g.143612  ORF Transcript_47437/g.143612 Transcript_47437/m.143612 type:complete len:86 (-) Transcript_47437:10-267(-)